MNLLPTGNSQTVGRIVPFNAAMHAISVTICVVKAPFGVGYPCLCSSANHLRGSTTNTIPAHGIPHIA